MELLLEKLSNTSSLNEKVELLKQYETPKIREAFNLVLNPNILTNIKKFDVKGTGAVTFETGFDEFKQIVYDLHARKITGNDARSFVNLFLSKCTKTTQELFKLILLKDLKVGIGTSLVEKAYGKYIPKFSVQLAEKFSDYWKKYGGASLNYWWATPKLDGIRGFYNGETLMSRNGKPIMGFEHIYPELNAMMEKYGLTFLDGELFAPGIPFQTISSIVSKKTNIDTKVKKQIKYNIFYIGRFLKWLNTDEMVEKLTQISIENTFSHVEFVKYRQVKNTEKDVNSLCEHYVEWGFEGVMLRSPLSPYVFKRDYSLLKHKLFVESDFKIVGFFEGEKGSELEGNLGGIYVEGVVDGKKIRSKCGSGFKLTNDYPDNRSWFWANQSTILGSTVEIKYQGITDAPDENGYYSLRFPIYRKLKEDR